MLSGSATRRFGGCSRRHWRSYRRACDESASAPVKGKPSPKARGAKPANAKGESKRPVARKSPKTEGSRVRDLEKRLAEALEQQAASSEILRAISSSPTDVQPVFDTVVEYAARLCSARDAQIWRREGEHLRLVAHHGPIPTGPVGEFTMPISRGTINGRA